MVLPTRGSTDLVRIDVIAHAAAACIERALAARGIHRGDARRFQTTERVSR